jgi:hypothetical protein
MKSMLLAVVIIGSAIAAYIIHQQKEEALWREDAAASGDGLPRPEGIDRPPVHAMG